MDQFEALLMNKSEKQDQHKHNEINCELNYLTLASRNHWKLTRDFK